MQLLVFLNVSKNTLILQLPLEQVRKRGAQMKRFFATFCLMIVFLCIVGTVAWAILCINDYSALVRSPATSGVDFFMIGLTYAIGFFLLSVVGLISAGVAKWLGTSQFVAVSATVCLAIFALEFFFSLLLCAM